MKTSILAITYLTARKFVKSKNVVKEVHQALLIIHWAERCYRLSQKQSKSLHDKTCKSQCRICRGKLQCKLENRPQ